MIRKKLNLFVNQAKQLKQQRILFVSCLVTACLLLTAFGLYTQQSILVTVKINGIEQEVTTQATTVKQLLEELEIEYSLRDEIEPSLETLLESEMVVEWNKVNHYVLNQYGELQSVWTAANTVQGFLKDLGIVLGEQDSVVPGLYSELEDGQLIEIVHHSYETVEKEYVIDYQTIRREDPAMLKGMEKVAVAGREGLGNHQYKITYKNGQEVKRELIATEVIEEKRDKVIAVGTLPAVSRGSYIFAPKQVLENVTLTAYSAGAAHTGKSPGDPQYGITRSGSTVKDGRTIAVDPKVIPLGTWVYIEGIGLRKAEDTGGAVKGKKIDVYYDSDATARKFGLKRGYKVYVIGKKKPETID
jgi:3D (Asp-Asp-Asp) domain-containing protein/sulfur carrier protein ThiS